MNPLNPQSVQQALTLVSVLGALFFLVSLVKAVLDIVGFFRRQPSMDQILSSLNEAWSKKLDERVKLYDFERSEQRLRHEISAVDSRCLGQIRDAEARTEKRLEGMHEAVVGLRAGQTELLRNIQELVKDRSV